MSDMIDRALAQLTEAVAMTRETKGRGVVTRDDGKARYHILSSARRATSWDVVLLGAAHYRVRSVHMPRACGAVPCVWSPGAFSAWTCRFSSAPSLFWRQPRPIHVSDPCARCVSEGFVTVLPI